MKHIFVAFAVTAILVGIFGADFSYAAVRSTHKSNLIKKHKDYYIQKGKAHIEQANSINNKLQDQVRSQRRNKLTTEAMQSLCQLQDCYRDEVLKPLEELSANFNNEVVNEQVEFLRKNVKNYLDSTNKLDVIPSRMYHDSVRTKIGEIYFILEEISPKEEIKDKEQQAKPDLAPSHLETANPYLELPVSEILVELKNAYRSMAIHVEAANNQPGSDENSNRLKALTDLIKSATLAENALQTLKTITP